MVIIVVFVVWVVVGVDLAGSPKRITGVCAMRRDLSCLTGVCWSDEEILGFISEASPEVVAIDAPLSFPREGSLRICDRRLLEMGVKLFPLSMKSMIMLTERGIRLKKRLEEDGYEVIEVYPGATQDLLRIPRKSRGREKLKKALIDYGVKGLRCDENLDELDAVTCAITAIKYLEGDFIAVGEPGEGVIIIPRI